MEEFEDVPLLTRDVVEDEIFSRNFKVVHQVWANDENDVSDLEDDSNPPRASSVKSALSQAPELEFSQPLSQISEPSEERKKLSRVEAYQLLKEATTAAEAAQRALEHICGENFNDASGEDLEARDKLVKKVQRNLLKLQKETQKRGRHVKDPNKTFLSASACEESGFQFVEKGEKKNEKGTQTDSCEVESKEVQTENDPKSKSRPFRKAFDQLKVI